VLVQRSVTALVGLVCLPGAFLVDGKRHAHRSGSFGSLCVHSASLRPLRTPRVLLVMLGVMRAVRAHEILLHFILLLWAALFLLPALLPALLLLPVQLPLPLPQVVRTPHAILLQDNTVRMRSWALVQHMLPSARIYSRTRDV
jgi:hypothetical protein